MSLVADYEPDWDEGTEVRYEEHRERIASGLCASPYCGNAALPDDDVCAGCAVDLGLFEVVDVSEADE